jgi:hypothetical protein
MRSIISLLLLSTVMARAAGPLDLKVALGKNVSTFTGADWPVDTDGNFFHGAQFDAPIRAAVVLPGVKLLSASPSHLVLSQDNDTVTMAAFLFPKRDSNSQAAADVGEIAARWNLPIQIATRNNEEIDANAIWIGGVRVFVRVHAGRGSIILRTARAN